MSDLGPDINADGDPFKDLRSRESRLGFVVQEPLDTMLRLERSPPPLLGFAGTGTDDAGAGAMPYGATSSLRKLAAVRLKVKLAELVLALEEDVSRSGNQAAIDGFAEVHMFLVHTEHLRSLLEG